MTYYITNGRTAAISKDEFATIEEAFDFARAPAWAGAKPTEIEIIGTDKYKTMGVIYTVVKGENPLLARAKATSTPKPTNTTRRAYDANGKFKGSLWLAREMDRADSDF